MFKNDSFFLDRVSPEKCLQKTFTLFIKKSPINEKKINRVWMYIVTKQKK